MVRENGYDPDQDAGVWDKAIAEGFGRKPTKDPEPYSQEPDAELDAIAEQIYGAQTESAEPSGEAEAKKLLNEAPEINAFTTTEQLLGLQSVLQEALSTKKMQMGGKTVTVPDVAVPYFRNYLSKVSARIAQDVAESRRFQGVSDRVTPQALRQEWHGKVNAAENNLLFPSGLEEFAQTDEGQKVLARIQQELIARGEKVTKESFQQGFLRWAQTDSAAREAKRNDSLARYRFQNNIQ